MENGRDSEVRHAVAEKRCIDLSSYHYPSFLCLLFIWFPSSVLWSEKLKRPQFCYFRMGDSGDRGRRCALFALVYAFVRVRVFRWNGDYTLCVISALYLIKNKNKYKKKKKKSAIVCFLSTSCPNTLKTTTDGCVSSERWFKPHISTERSHSGEQRGSKWLFILPRVIPGVWWRKVYPTVGHQVGVYRGAAMPRDATVNHANWSAALQCSGFKWRLFNHYRL